MERSESINIGHFQIVSQLGKGAQGVVYLATDLVLAAPSGRQSVEHQIGQGKSAAKQLSPGSTHC